MKFNLVQEKQNPLFNRKEVQGTIDSESTPSREGVLSSLSESLGVPKENIKIKGIHGSFGSKSFKVEANIYSSAEEKDSIEFKKKKEKDYEAKLKEAEKPAEETPAASESEAPQNSNENQAEGEKEKPEEAKESAPKENNPKAEEKTQENKEASE